MKSVHTSEMTVDVTEAILRDIVHDVANCQRDCYWPL